MIENKNEKSLPKMLTGAVSVQMVRCGKPTCKCGSGEFHGPYFYRFWREGARLRKAYIRKSEVSAIRAACDAYREEQRRIRASRKEAILQWRELKAMLKEVGE